MKDQSFEIKVSDLLNHIATDEITFEHKQTKLISNLSEDGISGKIKLSGIDEENVLVEIEDLHCILNETCDSCTTLFKREVSVAKYSSRFTLNTKEIDYANDEVLFFIDEKNDTINIEEMIYQAIQLESPFVIRCPECTKKLEDINIEDENYEEMVENTDKNFSNTAGGNIVFHN